MSKRLLEDMVKIKRAREMKRTLKETEPMETQKERKEANRGGRKSRYLLWLVALISAAFCFFTLSFLFSKAEVLVNQKTEDVILNENLSAGKDSNTGLPFNLMIISDEENKILQATGEKDVTETATGAVLIFNASSSAPQPLNIDTRLEGSNGKVYKTQNKTVVPGMSKDGTPGSMEVKIYGAAAGADYNSAPLDFKILGFKGTPKYSKFYARSKGAITGGFVGKAPDISAACPARCSNY